jgi:4'-phosphopantetheinyl transferase
VDCPEIKLWQGSIAAIEEDYPHYWCILDPSEQHLASTIKNEQFRKRYVEIHARLRIFLGDVVNAVPGQIRIHKTDYGKPYLVDYPDLAFNLSHTTNKMVVAIADNCDLGVDIEQCKPRANLAGLVDKCFAEVEKSYWQKLSQPHKIKAFYHFWTRKEAFVKATGRGIALGLKQCVINPESQNQFLTIPEWMIQEIDMEDTICGALVVKCHVG